MANPKNYKLLGIGNPLLDIIAPVTKDFLDKAGLKPNNAILVEEKHLPLYEELKKDPKVKYLAGGCTLNTVRVFQWALSKRSAAAAYMGCIGDDANAKLLRASAEASRVTPFFMVDRAKPTGVCGVGILDKERTLFTHLSAANSFAAAHLDRPESAAALDAAEMVYISGFFLTVSLESVLRVARHCSEKRKLFALNLSANFLVEFYRENVEKAIFYCDLLVMNEPKMPLQEIGKKIACLPKAVGAREKRTVIITRGPKSTLMVVGDEILANVEVDPLEREQIVDLNGAAFVAGYLAGESEGICPLKSIQWGHKAARYIIQRSGVSIDEPCDFVGEKK